MRFLISKLAVAALLLSACRASAQFRPPPYVDTDTALTANSDRRVPSQKAVKSYAATAAQGTKADNVGAVNGIVKSNGSASFSAAAAGTDYAKPASEQTVGDANVTISNGTTFLRQTAAMTAIRTFTLPAANAYPAGTILTYVDRTGSSAGDGPAWQRGGTDTVNGGTAQIPSNINGGIARFESDGVSNWNQLDTLIGAIEMRSYQFGGTVGSGNWVSLITTGSKSGLYRSGTDWFTYYDTGTGDTVINETFSPSGYVRLAIQGTDKWKMNSTALSPATDGGATLGDSTHAVSSVYGKAVSGLTSNVTMAPNTYVPPKITTPNDLYAVAAMQKEVFQYSARRMDDTSDATFTASNGGSRSTPNYESVRMSSNTTANGAESWNFDDGSQDNSGFSWTRQWNASQNNGQYVPFNLPYLVRFEFSWSTSLSTNGYIFFWFGKAPSVGSTTPTKRGFGVKFIKGASHNTLQIVTHDGTTLTTGSSIDTGETPSNNNVHELIMSSDGAGNVSACFDGTLQGTITGGPTTTTGQNETGVRVEVGNGGDASNNEILLSGVSFTRP